MEFECEDSAAWWIHLLDGKTFEKLGENIRVSHALENSDPNSHYRREQARREAEAQEYWQWQHGAIPQAWAVATGSTGSGNRQQYHGSDWPPAPPPLAVAPPWREGNGPPAPPPMRTTVPLVVHCQQKARDIIARMRQLKNMDVERKKEEQLRRSKITSSSKGEGGSPSSNMDVEKEKEEQLRRCNEETSKGLELGKEEQLRRSKITFVEQGHVAKKMRLGKTAKAMCVTKKDLMLVGRRSAKASSSQDNEVAL